MQWNEVRHLEYRLIRFAGSRGFLRHFAPFISECTIRPKERGCMTSTDDFMLLGACGLYCGACYHYRASFPEGKHLLPEAAQRGQKQEEFLCQGCRADPHKMQIGCAQCSIRACAESKHLLHCGLCPDLPCERMRVFQEDGRVHHRDVLAQLHKLTVQGPTSWLAEQEQRWTCCCGTPFSWYEEMCRQCGASVASYGPDPRTEP